MPGDLPPREVYHGTPSAGFDSFDEYGGKFGLFGDGLYFTENPDIASKYAAEGNGESPGVISGFLNIKSPMQMEGTVHSSEWRKAFPDAAEYFDKGGTNEEQFNGLVNYFSQNEIPSYEASDIVRNGLQAMGYDGLTHIGGGRHAMSDGTQHRVWIAFSPEQFKSRFNAGTFDPSDPNFLKSAGLMTAGAGAAYAMSPEDAEAAYIGPKGLAGLFGADAAKAMVGDTEKLAANGVDNEAVQQAGKHEWAKDAGSNTPNVAQAVAPNDPLTPSPSQLASATALAARIKAKDAPLEDTYQPADLLTAFLTGGGGLMSRGVQAALDPAMSAAFDYVPKFADAINPRNIVMGLMR